MRTFLISALALAPVALCATPAPVEDIQQLTAVTSTKSIALAPSLPFAEAGEADVCAMPLHPLPDVLTLHLGDDTKRLMAFCFTQ
ncbi:MAG: hypothetical protein AAGA47_11775 [Pseudomonadota bacterium]